MAEDAQPTTPIPQTPVEEHQQFNPDQASQTRVPPTAPPPNQTSTGKKGRIFKKIIIIVIFLVIAGVLAAAAFFFYQKMQTAKRDAQRKDDLKAIQAGLEKVKTKTPDQKYYPSAITNATLVKTGSMDKLPQDPKNIPPYTYLYKTTPEGCIINCTGYTIFACLENKNDAEGKEPIAPCQTKTYEVTK